MRWGGGRTSRFVGPFGLRLASLGLVILTVGAFLVAGTRSAGATQQFPILECVFKDKGTGQYNAEWGYNNNDNKGSDTLPIGASNGFSPSPEGRGQPTVFLSGQNDNVFAVTWNGVGSLTWTLNNHSVSATTSSTACATNPVPVFGPQTILWVAVILAGGGVVVVLRRRHRAVRSPT
jgi:hypothetical protein